MGSRASSLSESKTNTYDQVPYPGISFHQSHPDRLATLATLFGMTPVPLETCRVLELGCGDGNNLIPIAFGLPHGHSTGIDLAAHPIASAKAKAKALGLSNITFRQMDIMDVEPEFGEFDYIIAHGVYSWVPPEVQEKLLSICSRNLAPQGIAYVSYNAYPGGHVREMLRRMMLYQARGIEDPYERVSRGLKLVEDVVQSLKETNPFRHVIQPELERMKEIKPQSLFHDDFSEFNSPIYFYEFIERAERHGVQFLGEAALSAMHVAQVSLFGQTRLAGLGVIEGEQMLDFTVFRNFRATLLCHKHLRLDRALEPERVRLLWASSAARPDSPVPEIASSQEETFRIADRKVSLKVATNCPLTKAALWLLGSRWPGCVAFEDLERAAVELTGSQEPARPPLEEMLLRMYAGELVELHAHRPALAERAGERPLASPLARLMLREGNYATNLRHEGVDVDETLRRLILLLDGTRDRTALLREMNDESTPAGPDVASKAQPAESRTDAQAMTPAQLEENLQRICRIAVLVE